MQTQNLALNLAMQTLTIAQANGFNPLAPNLNEDENPQSTMQTLIQLTDYLTNRLNTTNCSFISLLPDKNSLLTEPFTSYQDLLNEYGNPFEDYQILATLQTTNHLVYILSI